MDERLDLLGLLPGVFNVVVGLIFESSIDGFLSGALVPPNAFVVVGTMLVATGFLYVLLLLLFLLLLLSLFGTVLTTVSVDNRPT